MNNREKAIVMAYTGIAMLSGQDFAIYHKYIEEILGRPVWTHELADHQVQEQIKDKSKSDFLKLCESPRVMTLEEVKQMGKKNMEYGDNPYETCIYERRGNARLCTCSPFWQAPQYEGDENYLNIDYCFIGTDEFDNYPTEYYGQWMRCWTSMPTNDQREAVAWE